MCDIEDTRAGRVEHRDGKKCIVTVLPPAQRRPKPKPRDQLIRIPVAGGESIEVVADGVCDYCGKPSWSRFHPCEARDEAERAARRAARTRPCAYCGEDFVSTNGMRYCGDDCLHDADLARRRASYKPRVYPPRKCAGCGKKFTPRDARARHCPGSPKCRKAAERKRAA
jgi:hypothetical protein